MTDRELIQVLTDDLAPRIRELCADDKMDCDHLCAGNILTAKCIVFQVADRLAALQAENAERGKEIERLTKKATLNAFIKYAMKRACEELVGTETALSRVEAERDAANGYLEKIDRMFGTEYPNEILAVLEEWRGAKGEG